MEQKFRLRDDMYHPMVKFCVGLTNYHIQLFPLRRKDGEMEEKYWKCLINEWNRATKKWKQQQRDSRETMKARRRLSTATASTAGNISEIGRDDLDIDQASLLDSAE